MINYWKLTLLFILYPCIYLQAQSTSPYNLVDPFIGTGYSDAPTNWGNEGGLYPGAVFPHGSVQLSPETGVAAQRGYHYEEKNIYYFTSYNHHSGYPSGASGEIQVMPVKDTLFVSGKSFRPFEHNSEKAEPGFYSVQFSDDQTRTETTTTMRSGIYKFTFPKGITPYIYIGDVGDLNVISDTSISGTKANVYFEFSEGFTKSFSSEGGMILSFPEAESEKVIELRLSLSHVSLESAIKNFNKEIKEKSFDEVRVAAKSEWEKKLAVIDIDDEDVAKKKTFYTALYHSLLLPWVISDVDGNYKGRDGKIHKTEGEFEYGGFSAWDTYRSLHPLLTLLFPEIQKDMMLSLLNIYEQTGSLPADPMTGNHTVPVLVDSYLKGIELDKDLLYKAMLESIDKSPFIRHHLEDYHKLGYLPSDIPESITRTVEYAYDDWALAQFANVMQDDAIYLKALDRSLGYRHVFNPEMLFMQPVKDGVFNNNPGTFGYKEGDQWVYTFAIPFQPVDLVNLMGGDESFANMLDSALSNEIILFDNETMFHVPYMFTYANHPELTQQWVHDVLVNRFLPTPGGIPGNDDLGSMSSWYVFSALGFYPTAPGKPNYDMVAPLFKSATVHLPNTQDLVIQSDKKSENDKYIQSIYIDGKAHDKLWISHEVVSQGGTLSYQVQETPFSVYPEYSNPALLTEIHDKPAIEIRELELPKKVVFPNEEVPVYFTLENKGSIGTKKVALKINEKEYVSKYCLVPSNGKISDTLYCKLYELDKVEVALSGFDEVHTIKVKQPKLPMSNQFEVSEIDLNTLVESGNEQKLAVTIKNIGWKAYKFNIPVKEDGNTIFNFELNLRPGESNTVTHSFLTSDQGTHSIKVGKQSQKYKTYESAAESNLLDLQLAKRTEEGLIQDISGFNNHANIQTTGQESNETSFDKLPYFDKNMMIDIPESQSLDQFNESITMMGWLYPSKNNQGKSIDLITKGDNHVLQQTSYGSLNFFAGGWGRGECNVPLPSNWFGNWHHIVGVCEGTILKVYIDGVFAGSLPLEAPKNLTVKGKWAVGRNEEFPGERIYEGYMDIVKIFGEALTEIQVSDIYKSEKQNHKSAP
ncbi:GH92 family glycosyl hydrolase [Chondrinema litorale]|uniref:GH92 family glycosyl hydrolase n=1 Tax=Chondrinema litorale TaxID=2994555 RepID=UPI0025435EE3|nr:GH92 family glycosyl hydrolase [Chondrinema litorale]UZR96965.1 GH92 family glycosyl hydrolase [Chondrinema litorale]